MLSSCKDIWEIVETKEQPFRLSSWKVGFSLQFKAYVFKIMLLNWIEHHLSKSMNLSLALSKK